MTPDQLSLPSRWRIFIRERFPLTVHLPMIALFTLANAGVALRATGASWTWRAFSTAFAVALLFFFRLRCFDEIKDYLTDCSLHPMRPLARGLLSVSQVKGLSFSLAALELVLAASRGANAARVHAVTVLYSLLMYREFFIGPWLRPHLTTYAVTHTFVSMLMSFSIGAIVTDRTFWRIPPAALAFGPANWLLFNVFEFARKTFAPEEETSGADSYSRRFGELGAVALCLGQIAIVIMLIAFSPVAAIMALRGWVPHLAIALLPLAGGVIYVAQPSARSARLYRGLAMIYQFLFYALVAGQTLVAK